MQAFESPDDLLNIKQAAALLNVSEISLRRWTNAGTLPCVRVGKRRERRFRHADLMAHIAQGSEPAVASERGGHALVAGVPAALGSHLCAVYRNAAGRARLAVPFLADGLKHHDTCFVIAADPVRADIVRRLRDVFPGVDDAVRDRRLIEYADMPGTSDQICAAMEELLLAVVSHGANRIRVLGDMSWALDRDLGEAELSAFERLYDRDIAPRYPAISLCLYDAHRFSGVAVHDALRAHPQTLRQPSAHLLG